MHKPVGYDTFSLQAAASLKAFSGLQLTATEIPTLSGEIELLDNEGNPIDTYQISIRASSDFPATFPLVFETGGKIPKNYDWHVYETDGHCCIKTLPEELITCRKGITLESFIQNEVLPYFFSQTFRRLNGYFLQERSHSSLGWMEYFREVFHTDNDTLIIDALSFIAQGHKPSRTADCFCGSRLKFRKCHRDSYEQLALLNPAEIRQILYQMRPL